MNKHQDIKTILASRVEQFKSALNKLLKVDAKTQNAYDLMSIALGYKDYNVAKGLDKAHTYSLRANLGTDNEGFWVSRDLGLCETKINACIKAELVLETCNEEMLWILFESGKRTSKTFNTKPREAGTHVIIKVRTFNLYDAKSFISEQLENLKHNSSHISHYKCGSGYFKISTFGKNVVENYISGNSIHIEYTVFNALIDCKGVLMQSAFKDHVRDQFSECVEKGRASDAHRLPHGNFAYLAECLQSENIIKDAELYANINLIVVPSRTRRSLTPFVGKIDDCIEFMQKNKNYIFHVYKIIDTHEF